MNAYPFLSKDQAEPKTSMPKRVVFDVDKLLRRTVASQRGSQIALAVLAVSACLTAVAQPYPNKPIRMLVGYAPGGATDVSARVITSRLSTALGQQVIVDNRAGAGGNIATEITARALPDGYTLLMATSGQIAVNPTLYKNLPFDVVKDFAPVTLAVSSTNVLAINPSVQAKSVKDLIALAKAKPGQIKFGSSGIGQASHLAAVILESMSGTKMVHVPYKGGAPSMLALVTGEVDLVFSNAVSVVPQMKAGKIKALAVTTAKRSALLPELPTVAEAGLPGYEANNWFGVLVPAKTPRALIDWLNQEIVAVLNAPDVKETMFRQGFEPSPSTPEAFGAYMKSESVKWAKVVKASGATPE